jgi:hypothetical protein
MTDKTEQRTERLADLAMDEIESFFKSKDRSPQAIAGARIASSVLASHARLKQSERAEQAMTFMMARELAADGDQLKQYIKATMPSSPFVKAIDAPKKVS